MINNMMQPKFQTKLVIKKKLNDLIARSKDIPSSTLLPSNDTRKELDVYYATLFL